MQVPSNPVKFEHLYPHILKNVAGDGNCLFNCFDVLLTGTELHANSIRQIICDNIVTLNFDAIHLLLPNDSYAENPADYLTQSRMREDGTYAGPSEIATFCHLSKLDVVVYSVDASLWIWFSADYNDSRPQVYLFHSQNHFQVVTCLNSSLSDIPSPATFTTATKVSIPHENSGAVRQNKLKIHNAQQAQPLLDSFKKSVTF